MTLKLVTLMAAYSPELRLKIFLMIGYVPFAVWVRMRWNLLKNNVLLLVFFAYVS